MDSTIRSLRRALAQSPTDFAVAARLSAACERAGQVDDAWDALAPFEQEGAGSESAAARAGLGGIAERNPRWLLDRLVTLDIRGARILIDLLVACGQARNPALVALAAHDSRIDRALRHHAQHALRTTFTGELRELSEPTPEELRTWIDESALAQAPRRKHGHEVPAQVLAERRERTRSFAHRLVDRAGTGQAVALLPWLVPLLTSHDPVLAAKALALVRRLTDRDGPPFPVEVLARELGQARRREPRPE